MYYNKQVDKFYIYDIFKLEIYNIESHNFENGFSGYVNN